MSGVSMVVLVAAAVVYVLLARWRGATWRSIGGVPALCVSLAFVEFGLPPAVARQPGSDVFTIAMVVIPLIVAWALWRFLRPTESVPEVVNPSSAARALGVAGSAAGAIDRARSSPHSAMPEPAPRG